MLLGDCIVNLTGCYYQFAVRDDGKIILHCGNVSDYIYINKETNTVRFGSMTTPFDLSESEPAQSDYARFELGSGTLTIWIGQP